MEENIKKLLSDKEEILWQGKPNKNLFTSADWFMIPSSAFTLAIILGLWFYFIPNFIGVDLPVMFNLFGKKSKKAGLPPGSEGIAVFGSHRMPRA